MDQGPPASYIGGMFLLDILTKKLAIPPAGEALAGRPDPLPTAERHFVTGRP